MKKDAIWKMGETSSPSFIVDDSDSSGVIFPDGLAFEDEESLLPVKQRNVYRKGVWAGMLTGVSSGLLLAPCFAVGLTLINMSLPTNPPSFWEYFWEYTFFFGAWSTIISTFLSMIFAVGFVFSRRQKAQFYKHLIRDWTATWTLMLFLCGVLSIIFTSWPFFEMLIIFCFLLIAGLVGGYVGGRWFDKQTS